MELNQALRHVSVLGAAGKMGRGISLLLLQEMAFLACHEKNQEENPFCLQLIDVNDRALHALQNDFKGSLTRYAEKNINAIRTCYADNPHLVSNEEIVQAFIDQSLSLIRYESDYEHAKPSFLIFEAIVENVEIKSKVFTTLKKLMPPEAIYFSNTSSIPISILEQKGKLNHRIIGFHFYNPPVVQKLIEIIIPEHTDSDIAPIANALVDRLKKIAVRSADVAGFIGNGQFIREVLFACQKVHEFSREFSQMESIYLVNRVTQEWLIRPMGIFQLLDFVGIDVCQKICETMQTYLKSEAFHEEIIETMNRLGAVGGQYSNGFQKNGFFQYENNAPVGIYSLKDKQYHLFKQEHWGDRLNALLGPLPNPPISWKQLHKDPDRAARLEAYFLAFSDLDTFGAELARAFLTKFNEIAHFLVNTGVAQNLEDVNTVMVNGFYHLYGPENPWLPKHPHVSARS